MNIFARKVLIFVFLAFSSLVIALGCLRLFKKNDKVWEIDDEIEVLFIGDSHIEVGIKDEMNNRVQNISQSGDNYMYTYTKLEKLINSNANLKTIVLGIDTHNIDSSAIEWYTNDGYLSYKFAKMFPYMSKSDIGLMIRLNGLKILENIPNVLSYKNIYNMNLSDIGSYKVSNDTLGQIESFNCDSIENNMISKLQLDYLDKIIKITKDKGINIVFLTMPVHRIQFDCNLNLQKYIIDYSKQKGVEYINLRGLELTDSDFSDKFHLNKNGAFKVTKEVFEILNLHIISAKI